MLIDEVLKALLEGIIYISPEPVTLDGILKALEGEDPERVKAKLDELVADYEQNSHGIQIRQVANGYKFSTKAEHHEVLRKYVKSLKPLVRLSKPALETLAVIAYRQPVTMPEIEEVRGVDSGGVIHTLLEKKLVVTSGRKAVVGRPILYRTSKDFLVHFGLNNVGELPSLKEFEEMAKRALGSEWTPGEGEKPVVEVAAATPPVEAVPGAAAEVESSPQPLLAPGEEAATTESSDATAALPATAEESGVVATEAPSESTAEPVEAPVEEAQTREDSAPPQDESDVSELPAEGTESEHSAEVIAEVAEAEAVAEPVAESKPEAEPEGEPVTVPEVEPVSETNSEVAPPIDELPTNPPTSEAIDSDLTDSEAAEAVPVIAESTAEAISEEALVVTQEPGPSAVVETASPEEPVAIGLPDESPELPTEIAEGKTPETAPGSDPAPTPEDPEPKA